MPARNRIRFKKNLAQPGAFSIKEITEPIFDGSILRSRLKLLHLGEKQKFAKKHPHAQDFFNKKGLKLEKLREHSTRALATSAIFGALALATPVKAQAPALPPPVLAKLIESGTVLPEYPMEYLVVQLRELLPERPVPLDANTEKTIGLLIERLTGIKARGGLEGEHLNTTYGFIGAEQHLPRYPGDTISQHDAFREEGITPGKSAWGYFAYSKADMTNDLIQKEKWYVVVQTLYLPDWEKRLPYLRDWYKYRKVIVVDTYSGKSVVAVVADSGPAAWTGKQFGGSPEVMDSLGGPKYKKGKVILFFVDDPENKIPLGPVDFNGLKLEKPEVAYE